MSAPAAPSGTASNPAHTDRSRATEARSVMARPVMACIVGSGFGGICAALALRRQGIEDFVIVERRPFLGGTWLQNRYPGAQVDVPSPLYSVEGEPWDWSRMYAEGDEIAAYTEAVIARHGLAGKALLSTSVERLRWSESGQHWEVHTSGPLLQARFVINASGPLSTPVIPPFQGRARFRGRQFHTNHWPADFDPAGQRVAVVGSGASAAQVIPAIAPAVRSLAVFQRSPHWVLPRNTHLFTPRQRRWLRHPLLFAALRRFIYWKLESRVIAFKHLPWLLDWLAGDPARAHLEASIADPALRAKLTPGYLIGCKRIILSDTLFPALSQPHVRLLARDEAIDRIDETGIHTRTGEHLELDAIVWATGFDATDGAISYPVEGRDGATIAERWDPYPRAYLGTALPGFPNLFVVTGPNTGIGHTSAIFIIEAQMLYIARAIAEVRRRGARFVEVQAAAEQRWTEHVHQEMEGTVWQAGGCTSWYQSKSGHVIAMFPGFSFMFRRHCRRFRAQDHRFG